MKKTLSLILALALCLSLCACGDDNHNNQADSNNNSSQDVSNSTRWIPLNLFCCTLFDGNMAADDFYTNPDGTVDCFGRSGTWQLENNILTVTFPAVTNVHELKTCGVFDLLLTEGFIYSSVPTNQLPTEEVHITEENYADYFEIKTYTDEFTTRDMFGEVIATETRTATMLVLKEEYACRLIGDRSEFLLRYHDGTNNKDVGAQIYAIGGIRLPLFGYAFSQSENISQDIAQFPMVKAQGTLVLIANY